MFLLDLIGIVTAYVSFFICMFNADSFDKNISGIVFAPLLFGFFMTLFAFKNYNKRHSYPLTIRATIIIMWVRAVLMPLAGAFSDYYSNMPFQAEAIKTSVLIFLYENLAIYVLLFILNSLDRQRSNKISLRSDDAGLVSSLHGSSFMYIFFFVFAVAIYFLFLRGTKIFSFVVLDAQKNVVDAEEGNDTIALYIFLMAIIILVLYTIQKCAEKYKKSGNIMWVILAIGICLLRISLLTSSGRMGQIYICFGLGAVLVSLFPKQRKGILMTILIVSLTVVVSVSIYKTFYVSAYGDYSTAIERQTFDFRLIASQIDGYLAGPRMVSSNMNYIYSNDTSYSTFFYDIFRNIFGVHYLFKKGQVGTVGLYNLWLYGGKKSGGYLFSGTAYSSLYFSPFLAPLSVIVCLSLAYFFERKAKETNYIEWKYLHTFAFSRLILCGYIAFTGSLNILSRTFILYGIVIAISHYLRIGK